MNPIDPEPDERADVDSPAANDAHEPHHNQDERDPQAAPASLAALTHENAELRIELQELQETLESINRGEVDALIVNNDIYTLQSAHASSNRLRQDVLSQMEDAVFAFDRDDHVIYLNPAAERRYRVVSSEILGRHKREVFAEVTTGAEAAHSGFADLDSGAAGAKVATHRMTDGTEIDVESIVSELLDAAGRVVGYLAVVRDVTERRRAELRQDALLQLGDQFRELTDAASVRRAAVDVVCQALGIGSAAYHDLREPGAAPPDPRIVAVNGIGPQDPAARPDGMHAHAEGIRAYAHVPVFVHGRPIAVLEASHDKPRVWTPDELDFLRDVAERTRATIERVDGAEALARSEANLRAANENLEATVLLRTRDLMQAEEALRQSQKMEAVGQLTGGIAHDFNNLLAGIGASLQVLQMRIKQGKLDNAERYITMGQESVRRAAALTQRLLAFARRQTLDPKPTDTNRLVAGMAELIRRTVGPSADVEVVGAVGLWTTQVDASQLENSLLNLCINARDAMLPDGGRITIATANKWLDERAALERELAPGQYVSLCVTDTGTGMSPEIVKRVFDPFFTTKPSGQGTGLGLSMVYGFVRQSGGQVRIYSEVGKGTTMCLYLPRHLGDADAEPRLEGNEAPAQGDGETVLLIEDEETIRFLVTEVLGEAGYQVVSAADGAAGLRALQTLKRVDLLITDVGLPGGINGRQVADAARVFLPHLKVLFITGYADNAAVGNGLLEPGMAVLTKPFEVSLLARKVREMTTG